MSSIISIGLSGMRAAEAQASAAASNIVHAGTEGHVPGPNVQPADAVYQPVDVVTYDLGRNGQPGGVGYSVTTRPNGYSVVSDPSSPAADSSGNVATPNIDVPSEVVSLAQAKYQFYASAAVVRVGEQMMRTVVNLMA
jgi:flagellar basal body rod protein FlgC